ncbi:hypothetical protein SAMD00019534_006620, partial [Acytostelium subglobosum LB1]|uniref:hypothetical protein n=1 Tax=Acytostelium subglobosum LB1 TaxID=1410327 RepID=UPI000644D063
FYLSLFILIIMLYNKFTTMAALLLLTVVGMAMAASGPIMIAQENGLDSLTIRSLGTPSIHTNPLPGTELVKLKGTTSLLIDGISFTVNAVVGTNYYVMLAFDVDIFLYGINLETGTVFIDNYSPNQEYIYVYGLSYDAKSDYLIGLSSINYPDVQEFFDVVEIDQSTGAIAKNFSFGEFPSDTVYSGIYAFNQDDSELYVVFRGYTNASESTQEGMVVVNTLTGQVSRTVWFTGFQSNDMWLNSLAYDPFTKSLVGCTHTYIGTNPAFVRIGTQTAEVVLISNDGTVAGGNGPVILPGGIFAAPGHDDVSSNTIFYVNTTTGDVLGHHSDTDVLVEFLQVY